MKKYFFIAAAAVVALASCSKVEADLSSVPDVKIGYQVASYSQQTKANETSFLTELAELGITSGQSFKSSAFIHAAQPDGSVAAPATFFNAGSNNVETVTYDGTQWAPSHPYYWPKAVKSSLSFLSWYDAKGNPTITYTTDGGTATLAWGDRTVDLKDNVMYADGAYHFKANNDPATYTGLDGIAEGVPTLFRHALAKVRFTVNQDPMKKQYGTTGNYTFWEVTLSDVALSDKIKNNGKFTVSQTASTDAKTTVTAWTRPTDNIWAVPSGTQTYVTANLGNNSGDIFDTDVARGKNSSNAAVPLTAAAADLTGTNFMSGHYFAVMPQEVGDAVTLTFKYTIKTYYGTETEYAKDNHGNCTLISTETIDVEDFAGQTGFPAYYTSTGIKLNAIGGTPITKWQMNHRYVYNITINPETDAILYDPAVEAWEAEESAAVTVPHTN